MNWCVSHNAHVYLIIHAAVVEKHGCAVILPAPPGSGKSTLCAALVGRGWRLLSDEMTLVRPADCALVPLPRPVSLKNASIDIIRAFNQDAVLGPLVPNTTKGTIAHLKAPGASIARAGEPARPSRIVFPGYQAGAATSLTPLPKARAFMQVADNAFNYQVMGARGFEVLGRLIDACDCHEFRYSSLPEAVALFDRMALEQA
jgi:HprK-related kinase A